MQRYWRVPLDTDRVTRSCGEVMVIDDRCKGCGFCIEYCPHGVLVNAKKYNAKGYHPPEIVKVELCVNCGFCRMICPEFAIYTYERPKAGEKP